jgi:hypothetical protein
MSLNRFIITQGLEFVDGCNALLALDTISLVAEESPPIYQKSLNDKQDSVVLELASQLSSGTHAKADPNGMVGSFIVEPGERVISHLFAVPSIQCCDSGQSDCLCSTREALYQKEVIWDIYHLA